MFSNRYMRVVMVCPQGEQDFIIPKHAPTFQFVMFLQIILAFFSFFCFFDCFTCHKLPETALLKFPGTNILY